jgi:hypothetical protein
MPDIVLSGNTAWSAANPGATDNVYLNGFNLTLDGADASTYTCSLIKACASDGATATAGTIVASNATSTITANLMAGTVALLTYTNKTMTVNGTATGGSGTSAHCVYQTGGITTVTNAKGGSGGGSAGVAAYGNYNAASRFYCTSATGGDGTNSCHGVNLWGNMTSYITNATGGGNATSWGANMSIGTLYLTNAYGSPTSAAGGLSQVNGTVTITNATGGGAANSYGASISVGTLIVGVAKGGTHALAHGVSITGNSVVTINAVDLSGTGQPFGGGTTKFADGVRLKYLDISSNGKIFYGADLMPLTADVRNGINYGGADYQGVLKRHFAYKG